MQVQALHAFNAGNSPPSNATTTDVITATTAERIGYSSAATGESTGRNNPMP